ncbi:inner membrane transporter YjeM [Fructilactobacillus fructivorans]|uniref:glutamate/gamma-aminobutyrate family transporter YjeM n=1 Tax=Fructilactobacillus fructivorans TaxID=1614 RepID=UPI0007048B9C|nr:glutamate/gamma-aminobutyrate family transporter YjeM [Fructilactobacillus fructivorans]KRN12345.1 inner membrane transporter YjeM [Fructilactobacillus fructivorans]
MDNKKLSLFALVLMIFTSVFGSANISRAFYLMGYASIIWYILAALCFFIPFAFMIAEFGAAFSKKHGGIYTWMSESVNPKFAFTGISMWYASAIIWMVNTSSAIWVPLSNAIFGVDKTSDGHLFGLSSVETIGILAVILMIVITFIATRGINQIQKVTSIGGFAAMLTNVILIVGGAIILLINGHTFQPLSWKAILVSPNPQYDSLINVLGFVVYAIFAYGGLETIGGLVDQTKTPEKTFPRGITISALTISVVYSIGIFMVGAFTNWGQVLGSHHNINLVNVPFIIMNNFGYQLGTALNFSHGVSVEIGMWVSRYVGISIFLALSGAFITLIISPIKTIVEGTPKEIWPKFFTKINKHDVPGNAMMIQGLLVIAFILIISFGGQSAKAFFNILVQMTNVAMVIPYLFIAFAFIGFKANSKIKKPFVFYKNPLIAKIAVCVVMLTVGFAIIFTIIAPALSGNYVSSIWMVVGPVIFGVIGYLLYHHYEKKYLKND